MMCRLGPNVRLLFLLRDKLTNLVQELESGAAFSLELLIYKKKDDLWALLIGFFLWHLKLFFSQKTDCHRRFSPHRHYRKLATTMPMSTLITQRSEVQILLPQPISMR
jgi:hypothetical protein